ncbi:winged helix-turn-helix domain-containing protein [Brachybacterium saurashtrense]|uniref:Winged helix-turn-helix domain-containing protein n=1 Tax=Brachybacterium saurashtrense TaxID=556288 RepID=A0A345YNL4_9MICO|nr:crosslink repair DNA glycosylase YcaQ family protein [Brachybacterium saurashtrense]AXK45516.1 winged helix-turn-helix domain-containing protein [Brachybacterium saurashtrense]RRR21112.1 winged helix-turn-helix domain-containing protein [Brachybacterium saurashtrense]
MTETLTWTTARRIALRAQGLGPARRADTPGPAASRRALARTLESTHLLQIDSVSVFARAHHLPVYTRSGPWAPSALERAVRPGPTRSLRESFAHEAAFATEDVHRLLAFRRRTVSERDWGALREIATSSPQLFDRIRAVLAELGPASAAEVSAHLGDTERGEGWGWRRTSTQWAVEYLFRTGALDCVGRSAQFERLYRVAEAEEAPVDEPAALRALVEKAARSLGVAEPGSLADYFRLRRREVTPALQELVDEGTLSEVTVTHPAGARTMLRHRDAPSPTPLRVAALVSPFDPLVFHRPRLAHLFDVDYRIGIYTPAAKRTTGYYSLLFLLGDVIPARVDLRADRAAGVLEVRGSFREPLPHLPARQRPSAPGIAEALAAELRRAARWQGLDGIEVRTGDGTGELSAPLAAALAEGPATG